MRVLHLDSGRTMRGGQYQVLRLTEGLAGHPSIEQHLLCRGELLSRTGGESLTFASLRREARRADVIHAHDAHTHTLAALLGGSKPIVVSRRVAFPVRSSRLSRWKYGRATRFLAVSGFVAGQLREAGIEATRIAIVPDGVPLPAEAPEPRWASPPRVLALDSEDPGKGALLAREACRRAGLELTLTSDLERDLPSAEIFLYLSQSEGLGSALILAALARKAIIASRVGGIPEVIEHERTGLLTENDATAAAAALNRLAGEEGLGPRLAEAAFHAAGSRFSVDIMVARTVDAYRSASAS